MNDLIIRNIQPGDNLFIATVDRNTLAEFGANKPGTVYYDSTTDALYELFQKQGAAYFIALLNNEIVGGAGIYPTEGLPADTCELVSPISNQLNQDVLARLEPAMPLISLALLKNRENFADKVEKLIKEAAQRAEAVIKSNLPSLEALAKRLLEDETVDEKVVEEVLSGAVLPKEAKLY